MAEECPEGLAGRARFDLLQELVGPGPEAAVAGPWAVALCRFKESWLGWQDSNLRYTVPKTVALPLGYTPTVRR